MGSIGTFCATDVHLEAVTRDCVSGCGDRRGAMYRWYRSSCEVWFRSSSDGTMQPAMFHKPGANVGNKSVPLLVGLHAWSATHKDEGLRLLGQWSARNRWALIAPYARGPNVDASPMGVGSAIAVQDVFDAVYFASTHVNVDLSRVYVIGGSGGAYLALMLAGVAPTFWAAVSAWAPIFDLTKWYRFVAKSPRHHRFTDNLARALGGKPLDATWKADALARSPVSYLKRARGTLALDINAGVMDGHGVSPVPINHALEAFNAVAVSDADRIPASLVAEFITRPRVPDALNGAESRQPSCRESQLRSGAIRDEPFVTLFCRRSGPARITIFGGQHQTLWYSALEWVGKQRNALPPPSNVALGGASWRRTLQHLGLALATRPSPGDTDFVGTSGCAWCHERRDLRFAGACCPW